jgi:tetratricopeptide (TPR) repeat protein
MKDMRPDSRGATLAKARGLFEQALAKDSDYAGALQGLANTYLTAWLEPSPDHAIGQEFQRDEILQTALALAERAVRADPAHAEAHAMVGWILYWKRRVPESIASFKRATELNPNLVDGRYAIVLAHGGRALEALAYMKKIMALDPYYPPNYPYYLGKAHFFLGDYDKAIELIRPATVRMPGNRPPLVLLAAVAAHTGDMEVAKSAAAEVLRLEPKFTIMSWIAFLRLTNDNDMARLRQGLLKAGLPDGTSVAKSIN